MKRITNYLLTYTQTQLIITLFSLPLLIHWGLGISWMSMISNFVFTPVLTGFIIISSLVFFTELLGIPNYPFVWCLDRLVFLWDSCLHMGSKNWLIHFAHPGSCALIIVPIATYILLRSRYFKTISTQIGALVVLLLITCAGLNFKTSLFEERELHQTELHPKFSIARKGDSSITFIDKGYFNTKSSPDKAVTFELKPFLVKKLGQHIITELTLTRPSMRSFWGACELCKHFTIKKIRIPYFEHDLSKKAWHKFFTLKQTCIDHETVLERFK